MSSPNRHSLALWLLTLVAIWQTLTFADSASVRFDARDSAPFLIVESVEECEAEESGEFESVILAQKHVSCIEVTYLAHIAEIRASDEARHRVSHLLRGPPSA